MVLSISMVVCIGVLCLKGTVVCVWGWGIVVDCRVRCIREEGCTYIVDDSL